MIQSKDDVFRYINGSIVEVKESTSILPWIFRYDRLALTVLDSKDIGAYWFKNFLEPLCNIIANPTDGPHYIITEPRSYHRDYYRVKRLESPTELIQIYYHPKLHYKPLASIEFSVPDKINGYADHVQQILRVEQILKKFSVSFHVTSAELCLDAPTDEEYKKVTGNIFLKNSTPGKDDSHFIDGERNPKTGKPKRKRGFHPNNENKYVKDHKASLELKSYSLRNRIELTFKHAFLKRQGLNYFSEILDAGALLYFSKLDLFSFNLKDILDLRKKSRRLGINPSLVRIGRIALRNLFRKTSGEILLEMTKLLDWKPCRIKKRFGTKIDFPAFLIETAGSPISYQQ